MIDVRALRENPKNFIESCEKRGFGKEEVESFLALDEEWRSNLKKLNDLRKRKNQITQAIGEKVKLKQDSSGEKEEVRTINSEIEAIEARQAGIEGRRSEVAALIPNLIHDKVFVGKGDDNNQFVRFWGRARVFTDDVEEFSGKSNGKGKYEILSTRPMSHVDLEDRLDLVDLERAAKVSGARFFYLKGRLLKLEQALVSYALDFLADRAFVPVEPPFMMRYDPMSKATDIETFKESLYKIEGEDLYLISTSEHPIAAMLSDEILDPEELPIRVAAVSPCFRREAGAHGKDTKGIFRVHQFFKVEQFIFCKNEDSWDFLEELTANAEAILQSLELPYRVIDFCSGELSRLNARKYDIEAWFPAQGKFREVVSASNNTDFQARSLNIRYREKNGNSFVATLNSTALATTRTMVAIMENFQDHGAIRVPKVLIPYTGFDTILA